MMLDGSLVMLRNPAMVGLRVFFGMIGDDSLNFLKRSKEIGFEPTFLTYIGALEIFNNEPNKSLIENVALVNWEISSPKFNEMYKKEYNTEPGKSADKSFDALYVMATAIANTSNVSDVADYIAHGTFVTPNSTISFMPDHTVNSTPIEIDIFKDGKMVKWVK
jgi:hypothetical protein